MINLDDDDDDDGDNVVEDEKEDVEDEEDNESDGDLKYATNVRTGLSSLSSSRGNLQHTIMAI